MPEWMNVKQRVAEYIMVSEEHIISELQFASNVRFREAYIHIRMAGLGRVVGWSGGDCNLVFKYYNSEWPVLRFAF